MGKRNGVNSNSKQRRESTTQSECTGVLVRGRKACGLLRRQHRCGLGLSFTLQPADARSKDALPGSICEHGCPTGNAKRKSAARIRRTVLGAVQPAHVDQERTVKC